MTACNEALPAGVLQGIELVWVDEPGDVRLMYQGILEISVAFYQVQQGNWPGIVKMMARGKGKRLPMRTDFLIS